jgi:hypothetical protein
MTRMIALIVFIGYMWLFCLWIKYVYLIYHLYT